MKCYQYAKLDGKMALCNNCGRCFHKKFLILWTIYKTTSRIVTCCLLVHDAR